MPGLMTDGAGQTENEVLVVGRPRRLNDAKAMLVVFGRVIQGTHQLIIGRVEFESAFMTYIISGPSADRENHNTAIFGPVILSGLRLRMEKRGNRQGNYKDEKGNSLHLDPPTSVADLSKRDVFVRDFGAAGWAATAAVAVFGGSGLIHFISAS